MLKDKSSLLKVNQMSYAVLFRALMAEPLSSHELAEVTGLHLATIQSLMRVLKEYGVVHVSAWDTDRLGRDCIPIFSFGKGKDAARRKKSSAQRQADSRRRKVMVKLFGGTQPSPHILAA